MNAVANSANVVGDFARTAIVCLGGTARFTSSDSAYFMTLERGKERRRYRIRRTIGSRFFQYYVGILHEPGNAGIESTQCL